jgi:predicted ABC-type ATPase
VPADTDRPTLHMIAGPNGAGKTTLYRELLAVTNPELEFVNADELALRKFGHPAATLEESQVGQRLADERRSALMEERKSFITESTFSHPSKLELLLRARELGYRLRVNLKRYPFGGRHERVANPIRPTAGRDPHSAASASFCFLQLPL